MTKTIFQLLLIISIFFTTFVGSNSTVKSQAFVNNFQKAINIRSRYNTDFGSNEFKQVVDRMKTDGANTITFVIQHNVQTLTSNDVFPTAITPTDEALTSGINYVKSKGMKAALNMFVDCSCGAWRAEINPSDRNQFFSSFNIVVQKYAKIAQTNGIDFINLGTEMASLSVNSWFYAVIAASVSTRRRSWWPTTCCTTVARLATSHSARPLTSRVMSVVSTSVRCRSCRASST